MTHPTLLEGVDPVAKTLKYGLTEAKECISTDGTGRGRGREDLGYGLSMGKPAKFREEI